MDLLYTGGGSGPVIIITPPPDYANPAPLKLEITYGDSTPQVTYAADLKEKVPARLFGNGVECFATSKDKSRTVGFDTLTLHFGGRAVTVKNDGAGKPEWRTVGGSDAWTSSGGPFDQWPAILGESVTDLEFVDVTGETYALQDIESVTLRLE